MSKIKDIEVGDVVRIIKYGHVLLVSKDYKIPDHWPILKEEENGYLVDVRSELIGQIGIVDGKISTKECISYSLDGPNKHAWYSKDQLELVKTNEAARQYKI